MDKVSVIINAYNTSEVRFRACVRSVYNSKGVEPHLIVSTIEGDPSISWCKDYPITLVVSSKEEHPGRGPEGSFYQVNKGLEVVNTKYVNWFGSDDIIEPNKLALEVEALKAGALVAYSDLMLCDTALKIITQTTLGTYRYERHKRSNFVPDCSTWDYEALKDLLPLSLEWYNCGFWDFWLRVYEKHGNVFTYIQKPTIYYIQESYSMHIARIKDKAKRRLYDADRKKMLATHESS